jgi:hypothetical protein
LKKEFFLKNIVKFLGIITITAFIVFSMASCKRGGTTRPSEILTVDEAVTSPGSSPNVIDRLLDEYEHFISEYTAILQKAIAGDFNSLIEAESFTEKMTDWANRIDSYTESDLSPAQWVRLNLITGKFTSLFIDD